MQTVIITPDTEIDKIQKLCAEAGIKINRIEAVPDIIVREACDRLDSASYRNISQIGQRYRITEEDCGIFAPGDIVVAIEERDDPMCVLEKDYILGKPPVLYHMYEYEYLNVNILEPVDDADISHQTEHTGPEEERE